MNNGNSTESPILSFIITCHNLAAKTLRDCLHSITSLSLRPYEREIILVDDGSDSCPIDNLETYKDEIIYIRQKKSGVGAARNTGLHIAGGRYVQFIEGDSRLVNEAYEHCLDIVRYNSPDVVLFDAAEKSLPAADFYTPKPTDGAEYMLHNSLRASACHYIFKKSMLIDLHFTPGLFEEDEDFTPQLLLRAESVYATNIVAYNFLKKKHETMHNSSARKLVKRLNDLEKIIFHLQEIASTLPNIDGLAMQRRVAQLTMEYIFFVIRLTHSSKQLNTRLKRLQDKGLYPLPDRNYTKRYTIFRKLLENSIAKRLLTLAIR